MTEPKSKVSWRRILIESVAVVLSILLAFAIDAWWDTSQRRDQERALLQGLFTDFEEARSNLRLRIATSRRLHRNAQALRILVNVGAEAESLRVPDSLLIAVIGGPTYDPATPTLDAALASGEVGLVRNAAIRREMARWQEILSDTYESEVEVRRSGADRVEPLLSRDIALGPLFDQVLGWEAGEVTLDGESLIVPSLELEGALAARVFYNGFAAEGLEELSATLERLLGLISAELAP